MGSYIEALGQQAGTEAATSAMGLVMGSINDKRQIRQQGKLQAMQIAGNKEMIDYQKMKDLEMWRATGYGAQKEMMKEAGLNPGLMYGMGGGGGQTVGGTSGGVEGGQAPRGGMEMQGMGLQLQLLAAQKENIEANTAKTMAETAKTAGIDTDLGRAQLGVLNLEKAFLGETFDTRIEQLNRQIEKTTQEARQIDQQVGITAETRKATVEKAQQDALGAALQNILIGEQTKATEQQINESKARVSQMGEQVKKWQAEIAQTWEGLSLKEKEIRLDGIMKEVESVSKTTTLGLPALTPHQRRQVIRQIDKIARIGEEDYK